MNIGIYSGSFNPIHIGHALLTNYLSQFTDLDSVWLVVTPLNPLKNNGSELTADIHRLAMARLVASEFDNVEASDFEFSMPQPNYTYNTLKCLKETYPQHSFRLIIGSDNWLIFNRWRNFEQIIEEFGVIVYPRPGYELENMENLPGGVEYLSGAPKIEVSSTFIRKALHEGKNVSAYFTESVGEYIVNHKLYI